MFVNSSWTVYDMLILHRYSSVHLLAGLRDAGSHSQDM